MSKTMWTYLELICSHNFVTFRYGIHKDFATRLEQPPKALQDSTLKVVIGVLLERGKLVSNNTNKQLWGL